MCIDSWKKVLPDYKIKLWNTETFGIESSVPYVKEAFKHRKWAFVADYIRMYALYTEGGIYMDSDVKVLKRFDEFLDNGFFTCVEHHPFVVEQNGTLEKLTAEGNRKTDEYIKGIELQAAVMGAEKGHPFAKEVLDWYTDKHFEQEDGTLGMNVIAPQIYARAAEKYGFKYKDEDQTLRDRIKVYRSEVFAGNQREATKGSYAIHYCENSWVKKSFAEKIKHYSKFLLFLIRSKINGK